MKKFLIVSVLLTPFFISFISQDWDWPSKAKNLKVLSKKTTKKELRSTMLEFCDALNVGCEHCHIGKANTPLSKFDFISDMKPEKEKARIMIKMMKEMNNKYMSKIKNDSTVLKISCATCHKGKIKPI